MSPLSSLESPHPLWIPDPAHIALTSPKDPEFPRQLRSSQEDLFLHRKPLALSVCNTQILPSSVPHFPSINGMPCKNFSLDCQIRGPCCYPVLQVGKLKLPRLKALHAPSQSTAVWSGRLGPVPAPDLTVPVEEAGRRALGSWEAPLALWSPECLLVHQLRPLFPGS